MCVQQYNNSSSTVVVQQKKTKAKKQGQQGCPGIGMDIKNGQNGNVNGALWSQDDLDWNKFSFSSFPFLNHLVLETPPCDVSKKDSPGALGDRGILTNILGVSRKKKKKKKQRTGWGIWTDALLVQNRALHRWAKRKRSDSLPFPGGQLWKAVARRVWLLYIYLWLVFAANHRRIWNTCLWSFFFR